MPEPEHYPDCPYANGVAAPELRGRACPECGAILRQATEYRHAMSLNEGPLAEVTSLTLTHETPRRPTRWERWIDRLMFWRTPPVRCNTLTMHFPAVKFAKVDYKRERDGHTTIEGNFTACSERPGPVSIMTMDFPAVANAPSVDLKAFLRS